MSMPGPGKTEAVVARRVPVVVALGAAGALVLTVSIVALGSGFRALGASDTLMVVEPPKVSAAVTVVAPPSPTVVVEDDSPDHAQVPDAQFVPASPIAASSKAEVTPVMFDSRLLRHVRTIRMRVTAYSPDEKSCGKWAKYKTTASGLSVWTNGMKLVAADTSVLPFGSIVSVPGYDSESPVPVLDRGGAIKGNRLDVLFPTHEAARKWGVKWLDVKVWEYEK